MDVLDSRRGIGFELPASFADEKFNGCEITFVKGQIPSEFCPAIDLLVSLFEYLSCAKLESKRMQRVHATNLANCSKCARVLYIQEGRGISICTQQYSGYKSKHWILRLKLRKTYLGLLPTLP